MKKAILIVFLFSLFLAINGVYASTESDFLSLINKERISLNKSVVYFNNNLSNAAYLHSKEMAEKVYFSHNSIDNTTFDKRIISSGYTDFKSLSENIAYASSSEDANKAFEMWKNSPGHYSNMISDSFNEIGLGVYSTNELTYYTLDMGKRYNFIPSKPTEQSKPNNMSNTSNSSDQNISSNSSVQNSTILFLSLEKTESKSTYYKFIKITGVLNEKSKVYYDIDGKSYSICTKCNKFNIYIRTKINNTKLKITAVDSKGNTDMRVY